MYPHEFAHDSRVDDVVVARVSDRVCVDFLGGILIDFLAVGIMIALAVYCGEEMECGHPHLISVFEVETCGCDCCYHHHVVSYDYCDDAGEIVTFWCY